MKRSAAERDHGAPVKGESNAELCLPIAREKDQQSSIASFLPVPVQERETPSNPAPSLRWVVDPAGSAWLPACGAAESGPSTAAAAASPGAGERVSKELAQLHFIIVEAAREALRDPEEIARGLAELTFADGTSATSDRVIAHFADVRCASLPLSLIPSS